MFSTMNLRHLRYFAALARERHHGRAAEACHVTQPTLSGAIRQLETEVGTPLIRREGVRMTGLTEAGERVLAFAQRIMTEQDTLSQQLSALRDELSGELRIGSIPAAIGIVPVLTTVFHARHAGVAIRVLSKTSDARCRTSGWPRPKRMRLLPSTPSSRPTGSSTTRRSRAS